MTAKLKFDCTTTSSHGSNDPVIFDQLSRSSITRFVLFIYLGGRACETRVMGHVCFPMSLTLQMDKVGNLECDYQLHISFAYNVKSQNKQNNHQSNN